MAPDCGAPYRPYSYRPHLYRPLSVTPVLPVPQVLEEAKVPIDAARKPQKLTDELGSKASLLVVSACVCACRVPGSPLQGMGYTWVLPKQLGGRASLLVVSARECACRVPGGWRARVCRGCRGLTSWAAGPP